MLFTINLKNISHRFGKNAAAAASPKDSNQEDKNHG